MELDELKDLWNKSAPGFQPKNEAELSSMLNGKSKSIIDKIKRNVWFELILTIICGVVLLIYALKSPSGALKWTLVSMLVFYVVYPFFYIRKLLLLRSFKYDNHIKANLEKLIDSLESYVRFYKISYQLLYPVFFCLTLLFGWLEVGGDHFFEIISRPNRILHLVGTAILFFILSTWFTTWYLKKLYGNHLGRLKVVLSELDNENNMIA